MQRTIPDAAQDFAEVCVCPGLTPQVEYENPFSSKRGYVRTRLLSKSMDGLTELARKIAAQFGAELDPGLTARWGSA